MIGEAELMAIETDVGLGNEDEEVYRDEFGDAMDVCGGGRKRGKDGETDQDAVTSQAEV